MGNDEGMDKEGHGDVAGPLFCRIRKGGIVTLERLSDQAVYYIIQQLILLTGVDSFFAV